MSREELLEHICFTNYTNECSACDGKYNCSDCKEAINPLLDEYDKQIIKDFAEWLPKHFDLRFSNNPNVWIDEYFNHTSEKVLEQLKEHRNE